MIITHENCSLELSGDNLPVQVIDQYFTIDIFPNPTTGIINIEFAKTIIQKLTISDITGKQIIEKTEIKQNEQIDLSAFESGIFIMSIQTDKEIFTTKIVKE